MEARIKDYMTEQPHSIRPGASLSEARALMKKHRIRHLPVLEQKKLVGLLTERDFAILELYPDMNVNNSKVEDLMIPAVTDCPPNALLSDVAGEMAESRHGCVVVVDESDHLLGIFTAVDALKLIGRIYSN